MSREKKKESLLSITHIVKVPKIRPAAYIFQRPFLRGLFLEALIFGGAYLWREISVSKSIGLAYSWKEIDRFCFILVCIWGQFPSTSPRGAYIRRGDLTEGFLRYEFGGLIFGGPCFLNFTVLRPRFEHNYFTKLDYVQKTGIGVKQFVLIL